VAADPEKLSDWMAAAAGWLGIEAEPATLLYSGAADSLRAAGPALLRLPGDEPRLLALLAGGRCVTLIAPDGGKVRRPLEEVRAALCRRLEQPFAAETDALLKAAGVSPRRRPRAGRAILRQRLQSHPIAGCWLLRLPAGASFWRQVRLAGLPRQFAALASLHLAQYGLWVLAWWLVGLAALEGRLDHGWVAAWALLLISMVPLRAMGTWLQGRLAIGAGAILKQRLLGGALRMEPDEIRHQGAGQLLGRVLESQAVESLALNGGFLALVAGIELVVSAAVLAAGAGGWIHAALLLGWLAAALLVAWRYLRRSREWAAARLDMTHELVERMVGHRTRLAQEPPERWHDGEDQALDRYLEISAAADRPAAWMLAAVPRGWLLLAVLALAPAFVAGAPAPELAIAVGGTLLAFRALKRLAASLWRLAGAAIAWQQVAPLFHAAARPQPPGAPAYALRSAGGLDHQPVVEARDLTFRYRHGGDPVLQGCSLRIARGDRVLLQGRSGGGKSTLAALIAGLRLPESGLILLDGLDRHTLGVDGWRRRVAAAPQFHENHVLTGTFAFNLMLGRRWPPQPRDFAEMDRLCRELGLGELLERMPAGLLQTVGDTGWQLSHGERSRLYIARALMQEADLVVLDESFAALDPENLRRAVACVLERAPTLMVIAHP
jgi:ATP-binding cassette subfamily B protein